MGLVVELFYNRSVHYFTQTEAKKRRHTDTGNDSAPFFLRLISFPPGIFVPYMSTKVLVNEVCHVIIITSVRLNRLAK